MAYNDDYAKTLKSMESYITEETIIAPDSQEIPENPSAEELEKYGEPIGENDYAVLFAADGEAFYKKISSIVSEALDLIDEAEYNLIETVAVKNNKEGISRLTKAISYLFTDMGIEG